MKIDYCDYDLGTNPKYLVGSFFHVLDEKGCIQYQGVVKGYLDKYHQWDAILYDWVIGAESNSHRFGRMALERMRFYGSDTEMRAASESERQQKERRRARAREEAAAMQWAEDEMRAGEAVLM